MRMRSTKTPRMTSPMCRELGSCRRLPNGNPCPQIKHHGNIKMTINNQRSQPNQPGHINAWNVTLIHNDDLCENIRWEQSRNQSVKVCSGWTNESSGLGGSQAGGSGRSGPRLAAGTGTPWTLAPSPWTEPPLAPCTTTTTTKYRDSETLENN